MNNHTEIKREQSKEDFRPLAFWSFNGDLEDQELRSQIRGFREQGFGGFFMHARAGMTLKYLGEDWMHACRTAVEEAEKQGITAWLYDENGWPSGFAGGLVPALGEAYTARHLCFADALPEKGRVLAAYRKAESGTYERITEEGAGADLYCFVEQLPGYADLLNPDAVKAFIRFTHERYYDELGEYFGTVIPGIFTDEPQLTGMFPFTDAYLPLFQARYGYDFLDRAWMLGKDDLSFAPFKHQASQLMAELFQNSFTRQLDDWCREHHLIFTGHFSCEDGLCDQVRTNFNLMAHYGKMGRPGIDFLGRRLTSPVLVRQVSDAAYLNGKERITSESFGCSGWDTAFNDLLWMADWQAAFGINSIVMHLSAYSIKGRRKRDYPAFFSYQEPWWECFGEVNDRIARVNAFLSRGRRPISLLVVHPVTSMWCTIAGEGGYSEEARRISSQFRLLVENLISLQKEFLLVTEEELAGFEISEGFLHRSDICCRTVMIPDSLSLLEGSRRMLQKFAACGGRTVYINRRPALCEGMPLEGSEGLEGPVIENRRGLLEKYFLSSGQMESCYALDGFSGQPAEGVVLARRITEQETRVFVMNPSRCDAKKLYLKEKNKFRPLTLEPTESRCFILNGELQEVGRSDFPVRRMKQLKADKIALQEENALTIDHCDVYADGKLLCKGEEPAVCADRIYEKAYQKSGETIVKLVYRFEADFAGRIPRQISVAAESEGIRHILVNGQEVTDRIEGWWIDKSFHIFPVGDLVKNGSNTVSMEFGIVRPKELEEQGEFEGYRNRFFYPIEPEAIYIKGCFDVRARGTVTEGMEVLTVNGDFVLTDYSAKKEGELTAQGMWFYRGNISLHTVFFSNGGKQRLRLEGLEAAAAKVIVNGKSAGVLCRAPYEISLSGLTEKGKNDLEILCYGTNRNLLGPHHHIMGNPHFVGMPTFLGQKGFTDFIYPQITGENTHTDAYSFVRFSCGRILLEESEDREEKEKKEHEREDYV